MNIQLMQANNDKRMSSREIAELCDKRHEHVCRDIELVNKDYESRVSPKLGRPIITTNRMDSVIASTS